MALSREWEGRAVLGTDGQPSEQEPEPQRPGQGSGGC